jgi:hypothetical protein
MLINILCFYLLTSAKKFILLIQLPNQVFIIQIAALYMVHKLRNIVFNENMDLKGIIKIDET